MLPAHQVCPNCHGSTRPHTWVVELDGRCGLCGKPGNQATAMARVIEGKIRGLRAELKVLGQMFMHSFAFDGQLQIAQGLMADLVALRHLQLQEAHQVEPGRAGDDRGDESLVNAPCG